MTILSINSYTWGLMVGVAIIAFALGLLFKSAIIFKQRKRILRLEDEMLSNHSRILTLEKKLGEARKSTNGVHPDYDLPASNKADREIKAS